MATKRRVTVSATINGVDDETFGSNEFGHAEFTRETILGNAQPQNVLRMQCRWGGECRVELDLTGQQVDNGDVRVSGVALLFEGTSESTDDLDGRTEFTFLVPRGSTVSNTQAVKNTDESGDFATIDMSVNNSLLETSELPLQSTASFIRGVLLAGKFRTQHELNKMSHEDQRNTLIVELTGRSNQSVGHFQAMDDATLAGAGAVLVFLREAKIREDRTLKTMSADDQRNTLIVEIDAQTQLGSRLQGLSNMDLVLLGLGDEDSGVSLRQPTFIRGVLLAGKFRTQHELNKMSHEDQRNTLIVELTGRSNQSVGHFQAMDDFTLAGAGAVLVFLREAKIREDRTLKTMSADDQRNTLIVEIAAQTQLGSRLQGLINMDLVRLGLGG